ncbi:MAG: hypothetical protein BWY57_01675 [Betaproteobacteria bacterium ADurb.Bin341]|nr:MAG: hypothetical protein BWY57_01675 [Betaproteobacteria bacterium ADurb.Bin341]
MSMIRIYGIKNCGTALLVGFDPGNYAKTLK